jgi:hypothetical protein
MTQHDTRVSATPWLPGASAMVTDDDPIRSIRLKEDSMREHTFDAFTRRASVAVTRRGSLLALGGAALATGLGSPTELAAKDNKDKKKAKKAKKKATKAKKKFAAQCEEQKSLCQTAVLGVPGGAALVGCCTASCFSGDFITCLAAIAP